MTSGVTELAGGGLDVHKVPGYHDEILKEPYIQVLTELVKVYLD